MKYQTTINHLAIKHLGLIEKSSIEHWVLLDYLASWMMNYKKPTIFEKDKEFIQIDYEHLIKELPLMKWEILDVRKLLSDLQSFGLIYLKNLPDNLSFFALTENTLYYFFEKPIAFKISTTNSENIHPKKQIQ